MVCPPENERKEITDWMEKETTKLNTLFEKSRRSIDLMREHRTALISAAVTGKIHVREAT
jgi:type I restriction enzyme S subunit